MPQQIGLIKLKGKIDGISFYQSGGNLLARMAKGPSKERIKRDPAFVRTQENNSEFSGSAKAAKALRSAFVMVRSVSDPYISSRLTGIFKRINAHGNGLRGQRSIDLSQHREQLTGFEFNRDLSLSQLFNGLVTAINAVDRASASIKIENVLLRNVVKAPAGATHVKFTQALGVVSDYVYDESLKGYAPLERSTDSLYCVTHSDYQPIDMQQPLSLTLTSILSDQPIVSENMSVIQCLAVSFYAQMGNNFYPLKNTSAMKVVAIF
jgi:hypothetical protein